MQIANPLYDTVFKYLLEDEGVAQLFLSALLEKEIELIGFNPQEMLHDNERAKLKRSSKLRKEGYAVYSVLRLDFSARVRHEDGSMETILIEVQKASNATDMMRFRRYLGIQLQSNHNAIKDKKGVLQPFPIYPIYFLGEGLPDIKGHGAVKVARTCYDVFTKELITTKDNFIENLTFDALVVCANELRGRNKTGLEKLLSIFNLAARHKYDHILLIDEDQYPEKYQPIVRRLQKACELQAVRKLMDDEDDYLSQLVAAERRGDDALALAEKAFAEIEQINAEKDKINAEKDKINAEKEKINAEKDKMQAQLVRLGIEMGLTPTEIAAKFNLSIDVINNVIA
jgi:hypothetical protein